MSRPGCFFNRGYRSRLYDVDFTLLRRPFDILREVVMVFQLFAYFGQMDNLFIGYFEDLKSSPNNFMLKVFNFLHVDEILIPSISKKYNTGGDVRIKSLPIIYQFFRKNLKTRSILSRNDFFQSIRKRILKSNIKASEGNVSENTMVKLRFFISVPPPD